jgi:serine/threonine-protein kinase
MPPEVGIDAAAPAPAQDMYSLGVILGELAIGRALWSAPTLEALFIAKQTDRSLVDVPEPIRPLVLSLLSEDPGARPTAAATREALRAIAAAPAPTVNKPYGPIGSGRFERARSPIALEPTAAETSTVDPFANLSLVALDERDAPAKPAARAEPAPDQFEAPDAEPPRPLELDADYVAKKHLKTGTMADARPPARKGSKLWLIVALVVVAAVAGGAVYFYRYQRPDRTREIDGPGVTIEIRAMPPVRITIDGKAAGTTPLTIHRRKDAKPFLIEGDGVEPLQVVPDRDQTVRLKTKP